MKKFFNKIFTIRKSVTLPILFAFSIFLIAASQPILNGLLQGNMNGNNQSITNLAGITGATGTPSTFLLGNGTIFTSGYSNNQFFGNAASLTNLPANGDWVATSQAAYNNVTNYQIQFGTNFVSSPKKVYLSLTADWVAYLTTNGPGSVAYVFTSGDGANHNLLVPWNQATSGGIIYIYNTNWISSAITSNAVFVLTNGHQAILYFDSGGVGNPAWNKMTCIPSLQ